jgi:hypothetical protein
VTDAHFKNVGRLVSTPTTMGEIPVPVPEPQQQQPQHQLTDVSTERLDVIGAAPAQLDPGMLTKKKKLVKKKKKKSAGSVTGSVNGSMIEGSVVDGSMVDGSVMEGSMLSGTSSLRGKKGRLSTQQPQENVSMTNFLADDQKPKKTSKIKKKPTTEELRIRESNRVGAIENFNRIRKEKKQREFETAPDPLTRRTAMVMRPAFTFERGVSDGEMIIDMDETTAPCGASGIFCGAPRTLRKPGDSASMGGGLALRRQQQQRVRRQTQQETAEQAGKCLVM